MATGTCLYFGVLPIRENSFSPCSRGVMAGPGAANRQDPVPTALIGNAARDERSQILIADRLAGGQRTIAKQKKRLAIAQTLDLARERLEKGGRADNRVAQSGSHQFLLEGQLGFLKFKQRLLHADRREQHHLPDPRLAGELECIGMGLIIHRPGIAGSPRARCETGNQRVKPLATKALARKAIRIGDVTLADNDAIWPIKRCRTSVGRPAVRLRPDETDHLMALAKKRTHSGTADRAGRSQQENSLARQGAWGNSTHADDLQPDDIVFASRFNDFPASPEAWPEDEAVTGPDRDSGSAIFGYCRDAL
jgi:hypothetical protein